MALISWLAHQGSLALPLFSTVHIDIQALGWTVLVAVVTGDDLRHPSRVRIASGNLQAVLKDSGAGAGVGRKHERVRAALVVSEIALACVLLVSAGFCYAAFSRCLTLISASNPNRLRPSKSSTTTVRHPKRPASKTRRDLPTGHRPSERAAGGRGCRHLRLPPAGTKSQLGLACPKGKIFAPGELPEPLVYVITPGFIRAMGIRMRGRDFTWADGPHSERVVLINASAARLYWPGEEAVGKILMRGQRGRSGRRRGRRCPRRNRRGRDWLANLLSGDAARAIKRAIGGAYQLAALDAGLKRSSRTARIEPQSIRRRIPAQSRLSSIVRSLRAASSSCWWSDSPVLGCCWRRSAFTASSPIRSPSGRRKLASGWRWAQPRHRCSSGVLGKTLCSH